MSFLSESMHVHHVAAAALLGEMLLCDAPNEASEALKDAAQSLQRVISGVGGDVTVDLLDACVAECLNGRFAIAADEREQRDELSIEMELDRNEISHAIRSRPTDSFFVPDAAKLSGQADVKGREKAGAFLTELLLEVVATEAIERLLLEDKLFALICDLEDSTVVRQVRWNWRDAAWKVEVVSRAVAPVRPPDRHLPAFMRRAPSRALLKKDGSPLPVSSRALTISTQSPVFQMVSSRASRRSVSPLQSRLDHNASRAEIAKRIAAPPQTARESHDRFKAPHVASPLMVY